MLWNSVSRFLHSFIIWVSKDLRRSPSLAQSKHRSCPKGSEWLYSKHILVLRCWNLPHPRISDLSEATLHQLAPWPLSKGNFAVCCQASVSLHDCFKHGISTEMTKQLSPSSFLASIQELRYFNVVGGLRFSPWHI